MPIEVYPLGSGQEVGRSCIIINIEDKTIMLDCGLHMTHQDQRRFPDFQRIPINGSGHQKVDLALITHFHLDHCGALPFFTEIYGYDGPIIMTMPTKALLPYMLEDYRRVWTDTQQGNQQKQQISEKQLQSQQIDQNYSQSPQITSDPLLVYNQDQIKQCVSKVQVINIMETQEHNGIQIKAYYAGHLLGYSVVYTGDFNSMSDRHLGAAYIDRLEPDLLISESTYATTIRDSKRTRERNFLMHIQQTLDNGGKVLIPCFALGRAQELSVLLDTYWQRTGNKYGLYFAAGLIEKANQYYKLFLNWESEKIQNSFENENIFDFKHIQAFDRQLIKSTDPMLLLATPGMLHGGLSVQVFKEWCSQEKNTLVIPGYCVAGTLGNKLLQGVKKVKIDNKEYDVRMNVQNMSFSAHADSKGIIQLIKHLQPKNVLFVHGEAQKMKTLAELIKNHMKLPTFCPENFQLQKIEVQHQMNELTSFHLSDRDFLKLRQQQSINGFLIKQQNNQGVHPIFVSSFQNLLIEANKIIKQINNDNKNISLLSFKRYMIIQNHTDRKNQELIEFVKQNNILPEEIIDQVEFEKSEIWIPYSLENKKELELILQVKNLIEGD